MRKIKYPADPAELKEFHKRYFALFDAKTVGEIDTELGKAPAFDIRPLNFKRISTSSFDELCDLKKHLKTYADSQDYKVKIKGKDVVHNDFTKPFDYKGFQPGLAAFFMNEHQLGIKTCYYCGIDYINSFKNIADYQNARDFINRASAAELKIISGLGDVMVAKILKIRAVNYITSFDKFTTSKKVKDQLNTFDFQHSHNHFTLDHIIPQGAFKFFSLCLYNLVPSCYSCNAKFKKDRNFLDGAGIAGISPTSAGYGLIDDLKFKILYSGKLKDIKKISDFTLIRDIRKNTDQVERYIEIFKLDGRYAVHKDVVLEMIEKKINNPHWKIQRLSSKMRKPIREIKELIYGKEIFSADSPAPLHKLKRDIAKALNII